MRYNSVEVTILDTVYLHGMRCIEVVLGNPGTAETTLKELMDFIDGALDQMNMQVLPVISIDARADMDADPKDVLELVMVLRNKNYNVIGKLNGDTYPRWAEQCTRVVAYVDTDWMNYQADEIYYVPRDGEALKLPTLRGKNQDRSVIKGIYLQKRIGVDKVFSLIDKSPFPWHVITPRAFSYSISLI